MLYHSIFDGYIINQTNIHFYLNPNIFIMKKVIVIFSIVAVSFAMVKCSPKAAKATTATETKSATATVATTSTATQIEAGHVLYTNNCGKCHGLKDPTNYTKESWAQILKGMIPKAKLNTDDGNLVTAYVMANAKQG